MYFAPEVIRRVISPNDQVGRLTRKEIEFGVEPEYKLAGCVEGLQFDSDDQRERLREELQTEAITGQKPSTSSDSNLPRIVWIAPLFVVGGILLKHVVGWLKLVEVVEFLLQGFGWLALTTFVLFYFCYQLSEARGPRIPPVFVELRFYVLATICGACRNHVYIELGDNECPYCRECWG